MDGLMDGLMDGWMDGWTYQSYIAGCTLDLRLWGAMSCVYTVCGVQCRVYTLYMYHFRLQHFDGRHCSFVLHAFNITVKK